MANTVNINQHFTTVSLILLLKLGLGLNQLTGFKNHLNPNVIFIYNQRKRPPSSIMLNTTTKS